VQGYEGECGAGRKALTRPQDTHTGKSSSDMRAKGTTPHNKIQSHKHDKIQFHRKTVANTENDHHSPPV
jgi:hypothetical protein